jgi:hypothetical protein
MTIVAQIRALQSEDAGDWYLPLTSGEILLLLLFTLTVITLIILVPQLLRANLRKLEMQHQQYMRALEQGLVPPATDDATRTTGRLAMLVPMVVMICAGTVTCFLVAYRPNEVFSVALAVWTVAGIVSLAAITGGVALIGRLAQLRAGTDDEIPSNPLDGR